MNKKEKTRIDYIKRINKVLEYVERNLDKDLNLDGLSEIANFSPFHFHRLFSGIYGETLNTFVSRKRIERSAFSLLQDDHDTIAEIGVKYGFNSPSSFTRAFKKRFGISPLEFVALNESESSKICIAVSKNRKDRLTDQEYICAIINLKKWTIMNAQIEVKNMPAMTVAYVRKTGDFGQMKSVFEQLSKWARNQNLLSLPDTKPLTVYHDNPKITGLEKLDWSACMYVGDTFETEGEIERMSIPSGRYAVGRFEIKAVDFQKAWESMTLWISENGYNTKIGGFPYEIYLNDYEEQLKGHFVVDICLPLN